jgi:hypothetical protein
VGQNGTGAGFPSVLLTHCMHTLLLLEGQTGEAWPTFQKSNAVTERGERWPGSSFTFLLVFKELNTSTSFSL